jgi:cell pole-organizing protein PopZ
MPPSSATLPPVFETGIAHERRSDIDEVVERLNAASGKDARMRGEPEILDLTEDMTASGEPPPPMAPGGSVGPPGLAHPEPPAPPPPPPPQHASGPPLSPPLREHPGNGAAEPPVPRTVEEARRQFAHFTAGDRPLLSSNTSVAVDSAFNALAQSVLVQNSRTLEDLVREMLRPMLKAWLDDNLPAVVERLVRAEIERVSRGRG